MSKRRTLRYPWEEQRNVPGGCQHLEGIDEAGSAEGQEIGGGASRKRAGILFGTGTGGPRTYHACWHVAGRAAPTLTFSTFQNIPSLLRHVIQERDVLLYTTSVVLSQYPDYK